MPHTPDRRPGPLYEEEVNLEPATENPSTGGAMRYVNGAFKLCDSEGVFDPRSTASGISAEDHKVLRQLIHFIDGGPAEGFVSGAHREITGTAFPSAIVWYNQAGEGRLKIVEKLITWNGVIPTTIVWKVYNSAETLLATVTDSITYSGVFETSRTRTIA